MLFNSYVFILVFLPLVLIGYFSFNHFKLYRLSSVFLLIMSLWFYSYFNINYLPIILSSIVVNYLFYKIFERSLPSWFRKLILLMALALNIGLLLYFKYYDFFFENVNAIFRTDFSLKHLILPLGISFFTFQQLSFVIDSYKNESPKYDFVNYALFVTYFPQLIAGPIVTHDELVPQLLDPQKRSINVENLSKGLYMFALGMGKKVLIADVFGNAVNWGYGNIEALNSVDALVIILAYTIQIYFDFSGYCDMATGMAKMMNIDLPQNFNSPYKSFTIIEFWKRWHMTLTRFFTKYVYIPLGGNRKGQVRMLANTLIVFLVSGLWHGADWTFVLWGGLHGIFNVITKTLKRFFEKMHPALSWIITFVFINITWVFFRADSISDAVTLIHKVCELDFGPINTNLVTVFELVEIETIASLVLGATLHNIHKYIYMAGFFVIAYIILLGFNNAKEKMDTFKPTLRNSITTVVVLTWSIFSMSGMSTFLYFNF